MLNLERRLKQLIMIEQREAALLLDSLSDYGMEIFETWNIHVDAMQYAQSTMVFEEYFLNIVATRHRVLYLER